MELYPDPVTHCDICRWWQVCDKRRRLDDHLSLVAGISSLQRVELKDWGIHTLEELSKVPIPIPHKPSRGSVETYLRIREQARVQFEGRIKEKAIYELLDLHAGFGLYKLPEPSPGDIFLDFEGDPFVGSSGLEYLTGWVEVESGAPEYHHIWAFDPVGEKAAFESFLDKVIHKLEKYPDLHIYHFGHYEPSALKRLMGRYATKEYEIDRLLRGKRFVDLAYYFETYP
ncbi:MAG: TM0106 family RecB-like putative nuclease [Saprospiraceae bacterium]|nr:TM0106 family RecB-like putative nuclease [Candidatus Opimibacter skivensis]